MFSLSPFPSYWRSYVLSLLLAFTQCTFIVSFSVWMSDLCSELLTHLLPSTPTLVHNQTLSTCWTLRLTSLLRPASCTHHTPLRATPQHAICWHHLQNVNSTTELSPTYDHSDSRVIMCFLSTDFLHFFAQSWSITTVRPIVVYSSAQFFTPDAFLLTSHFARVSLFFNDMSERFWILCHYYRSHQKCCHNMNSMFQPPII